MLWYLRKIFSMRGFHILSSFCLDFLLRSLFPKSFLSTSSQTPPLSNSLSDPLSSSLTSALSSSQASPPLFNALIFRSVFSLLSLPLLLSPSQVFAKTALEGTFRLRSVASQAHKKNGFSFFMRDRLYIEGEFRPDNKTAVGLGFSSSSTYGQKLSLAETVKIYPSGSLLLTEDMELKLGWNLYENKFPEIASVNNYEDFVYAFQGVFLEYSARFMNVSFWGGWPPELPNLKLADSKVDQNFGFGFFLDLDLTVDFVDYVSLYAAYLGDPSIKEGEEVHSTQQKVSRYGAGLKGNFYLLDLSYTAVAAFYGKGFQFGSWEESMYHLKLGFSRPDFFNGKIVAGWHKDSPNYRSWLYDRHENAGLLDLFLWGNLSYYFLGLSASLTDEIDIELFITDFRTTEKGPIQLGQFGLLQAEQVAGGESLESQGTQLGKEVDMRLEAKIDDYFEVGLMAGLFFPHAASRNLFLKEKFYNNIQLTGLYKF